MLVITVSVTEVEGGTRLLFVCTEVEGVVTGTTNNLGAGDVATSEVDGVFTSTTSVTVEVQDEASKDNGVVTSFTLDAGGLEHHQRSGWCRCHHHPRMVELSACRCRPVV